MTEVLHLADVTVYDKGAGLVPIVNWSTVGDADWTAIGTPTRSAAAVYVGGYPLDLIGDDSGAASEGTKRTIGFTGNADKIVSFLVKKSSTYAYHRVTLTDDTAVADRLSVTIDFSAAAPVVTAVTGSVLAVIPLWDGYWIICKAAGVIAANTNRLYVLPAPNAVGDTAALYIGVVRAWNSATYVGPTILRYSNGPFTTGPAETPSNTFYDAKIKQPAFVRRDLFALGATQGASRIGYGDLVLVNDDGGLDGLLEYGFDGWPITVWQGIPGAAYPGGFTKMLVGTMAQAELGVRSITVKLRDRQQELNVPLQPTKYLGDNALPDGLEGVAEDLKGKPKPIGYGVQKNVPAPCVNTSKLIHQVNDGAVAVSDVVYDSGEPLSSVDRWQLETSVFGASNIRCVAYGDELLVAGSDAGKVAYSADAVTWNLGTSDFGSDSIFGVGYSPDLHLWAIVGFGGKISTSSDGQTFTAQTSGVGTSLMAVAWGRGLFVAVGLSGVVLTSPDGVTWTSRTSGFGASSVNGVTYAGTMWLIVGGDGKIATSPDGTTWTLRTSGLTAGQNLVAVAFNGTDRFVAVGMGSGTMFPVTSPDAVTWTLGTVQRQALAITFARRVFVMGGLNEQIYRSGDGFNWTQLTSPITPGGGTQVSGLTYHPGLGRFVAVAMVANEIARTIGYAGSYANESELLDDELAPAPGTYKVYLAGGYFRLGASPAGTVTADVTEGATAADRTAAQIFKRALIRKGMAASDYSAADITALDALNTAVLGFWTDQEMTLAQLLDLVVGSIGSWWGVDRTGVFRIAQFVAPSGTPVLSFTANDLVKPLERLVANDPGGGLPVFKSIVRWGKNYTVQTDLAGAVSADRRAFLAAEWREAQTTDANVQLAHLLSPQIVEDSLLTVEADAQAEATRRQALRGVRRDRFEFAVELNAETVVLDLGNVISLSHSRYGLSAGKLFTVLGLEPDAVNKQLALTVWG